MKTTVFSLDSTLIDGFYYGVKHVFPQILIERTVRDAGWLLTHDDEHSVGPDQHFCLDSEGLHPVVKPGERDPLTVAYIVKGFWEKLQEIDGHASEASEGSEMDVMQRVVDLADLDEALYRVEGEGAGLVWPYDISEPFGAAVALHMQSAGEFPDMPAAQRILASVFENALA